MDCEGVAAESVSAPIILMRSIRKTSASVLSSEENCLRSRKTTRVDRRVSGKLGLSERDLSTRGHR